MRGIAARTVLRFDECLSKGQGLRNTFQGSVGGPSASDNQSTEVEHAADQGLRDLDALDFGEVDFNGASADEPVLDDDSLGSDSQLGGLDPDVGDQPQDEPGTKGWQEDQAQEDEVPHRPKRRPTHMNNTLALNQNLLYVACHLWSTDVPRVVGG